MSKQKQLIRLLTYLSFIFIFPIIWYFVERRWLNEMQVKIQVKKTEIEKKIAKVPYYWKGLNQFLNLNHPITPVEGLVENLELYQQAIKTVWDEKKKQTEQMHWTIAQFNKLTELTDFLEEIEQNIKEYDSDVILFNQSFKHWPNWVVGADLKIQPLPLILHPKEND